MDGVTLQTKIYAGFGKAAQRVGLQFDLYRPSSAANPMDPGNKLYSLPASFTVHSASGFNFEKPSDYKGPLFHALLNGALAQVGDYLNNPADPFGPFFIASMNPVVPILAVQANRTVTVCKAADVTRPVGVSGYGGTIASTANANETPMMTAWPASVLEGARGVGQGELPADPGVGMWRILLPAWPGVIIQTGWIIVDDVGKRMAVRQAELTDLGWNIQAVQAQV